MILVIGGTSTSSSPAPACGQAVDAGQPRESKGGLKGRSATGTSAQIKRVWSRPYGR